uniref:N-acetyltransferase domain-containing protein n=1 Tax=Clytia hemisphaerica TaxID=252671 RepID=A0A7M5WXY8_9CNID
MQKYKEIELHTDRLSLVRIKGETHGTEVNEVLCDTIHSLEPWIDWAHKKPTVKETIKRLRTQTDNNENFVFNIYLQAEKTNTLIGNIKLESTDQPKCYEVGYWLHQKHCGKGFTTECVQRLIKFARDELKTSRLCMYFADENEACQRVAQKTGFRFVKFVDFKSEIRLEWGVRKSHYFELDL